MDYLQLILMQLNMKLDSSETAALSRQLEHVKSRNFDVLYANLKARQFIPVSHEVDSGAETIVTRQWNHTGMAEIVSNYAQNLVLVDAFVSEDVSKIHSVAAAYVFTLMDLRRAARSQSNLDARRAAAARLAVERKFDEVAAIGDAAAGLNGFLNHPNVPLVVLPNGNWATATAAQIIEDLNFLVQSIIVVSLEVHTPNTLLLDTASFAIANQMPVGVDNQKTVLRSFLENNPYIQNIDQWTRLDTADAAGTGPRIVTYQRDPMMVEQEIPQEFEQLPPQAENLAFKVPVHGRHGGTVIHYPFSVAYADGV